ncbi:MAG: Crp/Fnr family transcriptional regulator [Bacteroidetes bacterium]|nr:Crp/Fnr family transcriptional regulator [Bacteroidota bacterium]MBS1930614.1 Crp/Fnr family transcriptional regulator [Bacteroidota bacterium]
MEIYRSELSQKFVELFLEKMEFTEEEFSITLSYFKREYVPRKYFYLKAGQISRQRAYINKGSTRTFTSDEKGGEHILFFAFEDWWVGDLESYYNQQPASVNVQAMEDCELLVISKTDLENLWIQIPKLKKLFEQKEQRASFATMHRLQEVKSLSAEERYQNLLNKFPQIFQRIPLQYIAMYLDIEPQSLSRMRKRLSGK